MQTASWFKTWHTPLLQPFNVVLLHSTKSKNQTNIHMISFYEILQVTLNNRLNFVQPDVCLYTRNCVPGTWRKRSFATNNEIWWLQDTISISSTSKTYLWLHSNLNCYGPHFQFFLFHYILYKLFVPHHLGNNGVDTLDMVHAQLKNISQVDKEL